MITGIGCFAKPEKLNRILLKMIRNYTLEPSEEFELTSRHETVKAESGVLLKALLSDKAGHREALSLNTVIGSEDQTITGFFLGLKDQKLNLSIFTS